jgi:outer membrane scaffolding protein for murein synthesis (MipA/OmpV family)
MPVLAEEKMPLPLWEIGAIGVAVSQQAYPGAAESIGRGLALPYFLYRGEYFRVDGGGAGIRAIKTPTFEVDIGVAGAFGTRTDEIEIRRGMPELGTLVEFGPRLKWHLGAAPGNGKFRAEFPLRGVLDLNDRLQQKGVAFEPALIFERRSLGGWNYDASIGAVIGDRKLNETFYGVAPAYATAGRPAYAAQGGLIAWRASLSLSRLVTPDLRVFGFTRINSVEGAANQASPLVQKTVGTTVGVAMAYTWKESRKRVSE